MQHTHDHVKDNYVNMRNNYVHLRLKLCSMSTPHHVSFPHKQVACEHIYVRMLT